MKNNFSNRLIDSVPDEECYTIDEVASELGLGPQRARQVIKQALAAGKIQNLVKKGKDGISNLYAPQMVENLVRVYKAGEVVKPRKRDKYSTSALDKAPLLIQVPIFDKEVADVLTAHFGTPDNIREFLRTKLNEAYQPKMQQLKALEEDYEKRRKALLGSSSNQNGNT